MKSSEILTRAAKLVDEAEFSAAYAIVLFAEARQAHDIVKYCQSLIGKKDFASVDHCVMALLLCAAIAADAGD